MYTYIRLLISLNNSIVLTRVEPRRVSVIESNGKDLALPEQGDTSRNGFSILSFTLYVLPAFVVRVWRAIFPR